MSDKLDPYKGINFVERHAVINDSEGNVIFDQKVTFPDYFDDNSVRIVASKYLCNNAKKQETHLTDMIDRVSNTIADWGKKDGYFETDEQCEKFRYDLKKMQVKQLFAFNSPVYFNVGISENPQASACFILSVDDDMDSITNLNKSESVIFKGGSGAGSNLSNIRGSGERVKKGGFASGPVSFLKVSDTQAGIIRSGGTLRRAAKLACLDIDHPDVVKFIKCKDKEENKMRILMDAGLVAEEGYEMSDEVSFQNTNLSIRLSKEFMDAVKRNDDWCTINRTDGVVADTYKAQDLLMMIAEYAHKTGDPGVMYSSNINKMNTVPSHGSINAANPCIEYMFLDDTSCNLVAYNMKKFFDANGDFDFDLFISVISVIITAMDIIVDNATYPLSIIENNTKKYRALGLGYTNLGALLMMLGMPYDSDEARELASFMSSLTTGVGYLVSQQLAKIKGSPKWWNRTTKRSMYKVLDTHYQSLLDINPLHSQAIKDKAIEIWDQVLEGDVVRNAQISLCQPTGTTSFLMGADTTGIEPDYALVKYKRLSGQGGAMLPSVNGTVKDALKNLGYGMDEIDLIINEMSSGIPPEKSDYLLPVHVSIFDTAMPPENGKRYISYDAHLKMMGAIQPFISGALSKTVNLPKDTTVKEIYDIYLKSSDMGLKAVAVYRDGSKNISVLSTSKTESAVASKKVLPIDRTGTTHKFTIGGSTKGYITSNDFDDGTLGEVFVNVARQGTTLSSLIDAFFTLTSISLQHGVSLKDITKRMIFTKFEPSGFTKNPEIRTTSSLLDYIFRHLALKYLPDDDLSELGLKTTKKVTDTNKVSESVVSDEVCPSCGSQMRLLGSCNFCDSCAYNSGSCG